MTEPRPLAPTDAPPSVPTPGRGPLLPAVGGSSITEVFAARAARTPGAVAVRDGAASLTYGRLSAVTGDLARALTGWGTGPESRVTVLMDPCAALVVASLGTLRAGGAYVPLDGRWPAARMRQAVRGVQARVLLVDSVWCGHPWVREAAASGVRVLRLDAAGAVVGGAPSAAGQLPAAAGGGRLAYVMFTSGSAGEPKPVGVTHGDVVALAGDRMFRGVSDAVLMHSAYAFDASTFEMWTPLLAGGLVRVAAPDLVQPATLGTLIRDEALTAMFATTALFNVLAEADPAVFAGLRMVCTGGEAAAAGILQKVADACPGTAVHHVYGPTETTTFATRARLRPGGPGGAVAPIGTAMAGMTAYVLDIALRPTPRG
jgi:non-ribosomal peptide synthetase component F